MTLSIRWKVTIGALLVLACGLLIARTLAVRSLDQQEIVQSGQILEAQTSLIAYGLQPFLTQPGALSSTPQLQAAVRDLSVACPRTRDHHCSGWTGVGRQRRLG